MTYAPLSAAQALSEQKWPNGTVPLVSVRVITYMHEAYLCACLDGILMQKTTFPVEVNIHDDASTDGTVEIIRRYAEKHPDIIRPYLQQTNTYGKPDMMQKREPYKAMFRGRYVARCEGDDYWTDPFKLQQQIEFLEKHPDYAGCFHNAVVQYEDGRPDELFTDFEWNTIDRNRSDYSIRDVIAAPLIPTPSFVFRYDPKHSLFNFLSKVQSGDMVGNILVAHHGKLRYMDACMCVYRKHPGGVTRGHHGDFINVNRMYMHLRLLIYFKGRHLGAFRDVLRQHVQNVSTLSAIPRADRLMLYVLFPWSMCRRTVREVLQPH